MKRYWYWLIVVGIFIIHELFIIASTHQIRYEELSESVRNVWWLQNRLIYDGISSNVGWYGLLLVIYNLFGFSLNTALIFKLVLFAVSLFCLAILLKKYMGEKIAWLPLLVIGLSPTLIYFTALRVQLGIDLLFLPILLLILSFVKSDRMIALYWFLCMLAWLSYPVFIFYLPALATLFFVKAKPISANKLILSLMSFFTPLAVAFAFVKNSDLLVFDAGNRAGVFRGGGKFLRDGDQFSQNITILLTDFFLEARSYYFEVAKGDFFDIYPVISVTLVFILAAYLFFKVKKWRLIIGLPVLVLALNLAANSLSADPGIRRATPILVSFYALFSISWLGLMRAGFDSKVKIFLLSVLMLLPLHSLLVLPANFADFQKASEFQDRSWFKKEDDPDKSLQSMLNVLKSQQLDLNCLDYEALNIYCRYQEIYAALAGSCFWNKVECNKIWGFDPKSSSMKQLSIKAFERK